MGRYYKAADILVLPTRADVWGVTTVEAMASGIPSVVTSVAGSSSVVRDADAGIVLSEPFDVRDFREAVRRLAGDPGLRQALGQRGLAAAQNHSWESRGAIVEDDLVTVAERRRDEG